MPAATPLCRQQRAAPRRGCAPTPLCAPGSAAAPTAGRAEERRKGRTPPESSIPGRRPPAPRPGMGRGRSPTQREAQRRPRPAAAPPLRPAPKSRPRARPRGTRGGLSPAAQRRAARPQRSALSAAAVRPSVRPLRFHRGNRSARAPNPAEPPTNAASDKHKEPFMAQRGAEPQPGSGRGADGETTPLRAPSPKAELRPRRGGGRREPRAVRDGGPGRTGCGGRGAQPGGHSDGSGTERRSAGTAWA